ncbi:hypothetical protein [Nubsella zeaxanthinifaciens]|uniref:hypothetical protein n=1 Tax=Nubsella zeaxanthinifaciens TaxID=392412 RepID=UPI0013008B16|nr:hypothetical protein [Nubsella zeaxanthinifaciens]
MMCIKPRHFTQSHVVLILLFQKEALGSNKTQSEDVIFNKDLTMKKPEKTTSEKTASTKSTLKTERPLAEKDEVKAAEERQRKKSGK